LRNNKIGMELTNRIIGKCKIKGIGNRKGEISTGKEEEVEVEVLLKGNNIHIVTD